MATKTQAPPIDFDAARLLWERYDVARALYWVSIAYPGSHGEYEVQGYANGENATCTCWGFKKHHKCKHANQLCEFVAALARERVGKESSAVLLSRLDEYRVLLRPTYADRTAMGAIRAVLAKRGVRVPAAAAVVERGRAAVDELFGEAS